MRSLWKHRLRSFSLPMFEKWTKRAASKATDNAVEGIKESLNDKLETYSGIIKIGLTLAVIIFGSVKINDHHTKKQQPPVSGGTPYYPQAPIVINNYITDGRQTPYGRQPQKQNQRKH